MFDREMNAILDLLDKRVFTLEMAAQGAQPMPKTRHDDGSSTQVSPHQRQARGLDRDSLNSSRGYHRLPTGTSTQSTPSLYNSPVADPPPSRMKTRAYEFSAIFDDCFSQLDILHRALIINSTHRNNNHHHVSDTLSLVPLQSEDTSPDCSPFALHLAGIIT